MKRFRKGLAVFSASALAASMLMPAGYRAAFAEEATETRVCVDYEKEELLVDGASLAKKIYVVMVKNGKEQTPDIYTARANGDKTINISEYVKKGAELKIYTDVDKKAAGDNAITGAKVKIPAQGSKLKASLDTSKNEIKLEVNGSVVPAASVECRTSTTAYSTLGAINVEDYYTKGATLWIRRAASGAGMSYKASIEEGEGYFATKDAKLKIKARAAAPTVKLDAVKGTLSFPKNVEILTTGYRNDRTVVTGAAAYSEKTVIAIDEFMSKVTTGGIAVSKAAFGANPPASHAAVVEVKIAPTEKRIASKTTEVMIPWQKVITSSEAITASSFKIDFNYKNQKKTAKMAAVERVECTGLTIKNADDKVKYQYAVVDTEGTIPEAKSWKTLKQGKKKVFKKSKLPANKILAVRTLGVNDVKKTKDVNELKLASNIVYSDPVVYPEKVGSDLSVTWTKYTRPKSASGASLTVGAASDGYEYYYEVSDKKITAYSINKEKPSGATSVTAAEAKDVSFKNDQYVIVYQVKDGVVTKFNCQKPGAIS